MVSIGTVFDKKKEEAAGFNFPIPNQFLPQNIPMPQAVRQSIELQNTSPPIMATGSLSSQGLGFIKPQVPSMMDVNKPVGAMVRKKRTKKTKAKRKCRCKK